MGSTTFLGIPGPDTPHALGTILRDGWGVLRTGVAPVPATNGAVLLTVDRGLGDGDGRRRAGLRGRGATRRGRAVARGLRRRVEPRPARAERLDDRALPRRRARVPRRSATGSSSSSDDRGSRAGRARCAPARRSAWAPRSRPWRSSPGSSSRPRCPVPTAIRCCATRTRSVAAAAATRARTTRSSTSRRGSARRRTRSASPSSRRSACTGGRSRSTGSTASSGRSRAAAAPRRSVLDDPDTTGGVRQRFRLTGLTERWLPAAYEPIGISLPDARVLPESRTLFNDDSAVIGLEYDVTSRVPPTAVTPAQAAATARPVPDSVRRYLQLPDDFPASVRRTAQRTTAAARRPPTTARSRSATSSPEAPSPTTSTCPAGSGNHAMEEFLAVRRGFCQQFAGTFAAMARSVGLPSRVVVGYNPGTYDDDAGMFRVTDANAARLGRGLARRARLDALRADAGRHPARCDRRRHRAPGRRRRARPDRYHPDDRGAGVTAPSDRGPAHGRRRRGSVSVDVGRPEAGGGPTARRWIVGGARWSSLIVLLVARVGRTAWRRSRRRAGRRNAARPRGRRGCVGGGARPARRERDCRPRRRTPRARSWRAPRRDPLPPGRGPCSAASPTRPRSPSGPPTSPRPTTSSAPGPTSRRSNGPSGRRPRARPGSGGPSPACSPAPPVGRPRPREPAGHG